MRYVCILSHSIHSIITINGKEMKCYRRIKKKKKEWLYKPDIKKFILGQFAVIQYATKVFFFHILDKRRLPVFFFFLRHFFHQTYSTFRYACISKFMRRRKEHWNYKLTSMCDYRTCKYERRVEAEINNILAKHESTKQLQIASRVR